MVKHSGKPPRLRGNNLKRLFGIVYHEILSDASFIFGNFRTNDVGVFVLNERNTLGKTFYFCA